MVIFTFSCSLICFFPKGLKTPFSNIASTVFAIAFSPFIRNYTFIVSFVKAKLSPMREKKILTNTVVSWLMWIKSLNISYKF